MKALQTAVAVQVAAVIPFHAPVPRARRVEPAALVLRVLRSACAEPTVAVVQLAEGRTLASWRGEVARQLLAAPVFERIVSGDGDYACSQRCVNRMLLAAAAIEAGLAALRERRDAALMAATDHEPLAGGFAPEPLQRRVGRLQVVLGSDAAFVAGLLFEHPGEHFTARDVAGLAALVAPARRALDVANVLDTLADKAVVQRIDVDGGPTFFDIDTRPHAHRYDARSGRLLDLR